MNTRLKAYIAQTLQELHTKNKIDWMEEADLIMERMLDPKWNPEPIKVKRNSTKIDSYNQFLLEYTSDLHKSIYNCIVDAEEPMSRQELANSLGVRLSTICGRVSELLDSEVIVRSGKKVDSSTKRMVETLEARITK